MLFKEFNSLFFHIGKTAGTAIELWLYGKKLGSPAEPNREILYGWDPLEEIYLHHASAATILRLIGEEAFEQHYKFSVVRNPYERMVSVYYYEFVSHQKQYGSFSNFIRALPRLNCDPQKTKGTHPISQTWYTHIEGQRICDDIVHFEGLPQSLDPVRSKLAISRPFLQRNTGRQKNYPNAPVADLYDQGMIHIMEDLFAHEFEEFSYSPDPSVRENIRTIQLDSGKLPGLEWTKIVVTPRHDTEVSIVNGTYTLINTFTQTRHSLTPVARFIWKFFTPGNTLPQIQSALCKHYDVSENTAHQDLLELVTQLRKAGLVQVDRK